MYIEFVIGYILCGVLALLLAVVIILQCVIIKKISRGTASYSKGNAYSDAHGITVCRNCASPFDAAQSICPRCGMSR